MPINSSIYVCVGSPGTRISRVGVAEERVYTRPRVRVTGTGNISDKVRVPVCSVYPAGYNSKCLVLIVVEWATLVTRYTCTRVLLYSRSKTAATRIVISYHTSRRLSSFQFRNGRAGIGIHRPCTSSTPPSHRASAPCAVLRTKYEQQH